MTMRRALLILAILTAVIGGFVFGRLTGSEQVALNVNAVKRVFTPPPPPPKDDGSKSGDLVLNDMPGLMLEVPGEQAAVGNVFDVAGRASADFDKVSVVVRDAAGVAVFSELVQIEFGSGSNFGRFSCTVSLLSLPAVSGSVEVAPLRADGSAGDTVSRTIIFLEPGTVGLKLFFQPQEVGADCTELVSVERRVSDKGQIFRLAIEQLLAGPTDLESAQGIKTAIPTVAKLRSVAADAGGTVTADFYQTLERGVAGSCRVMAIREQITRTLLQFPEVRDVIISVNGNADEALQP